MTVARRGSSPSRQPCSALLAGRLLTPPCRPGLCPRGDIAYGSARARRSISTSERPRRTARRDLLLWRVVDLRSKADYCSSPRPGVPRIAVVIPDYRLLSEVRFPLSSRMRHGDPLGCRTPRHGTALPDGHSARRPQRLHLAAHTRFLAEAGVDRTACPARSAGRPYDFLPLTSRPAAVHLQRPDDPRPCRSPSPRRRWRRPWPAARRGRPTVWPRNSRVWPRPGRRRGAPAALIPSRSCRYRRGDVVVLRGRRRRSDTLAFIDRPDPAAEDLPDLARRTGRNAGGDKLRGGNRQMIKRASPRCSASSTDRPGRHAMGRPAESPPRSAIPGPPLHHGPHPADPDDLRKEIQRVPHMTDQPSA